MEPKNITDERKAESKQESDDVTALKNTVVKKSSSMTVSGMNRPLRKVILSLRFLLT